MGKGVIKISQELFEQLFDFPEGTKVIGIKENFTTRTIDFLVESPRLETVPEGYEAPVIDMVVSNRDKAYDIFVSENIRVPKNKRFELQI